MKPDVKTQKYSWSPCDAETPDARIAKFLLEMKLEIWTLIVTLVLLLIFRLSGPNNKIISK